MANIEQLDRLKQGADAWNKWRKEYPEIIPDLSGADLSGKDLSGADLRDADLEGANLQGTKLSPNKLLSNGNLRGANLYKADLSGADLQDANLSGAELFKAKLREAYLCGAILSGVNGGLRTEQLAGADLSGATLPDQLKTLYDKLENVKGISESARKIFLAVLAGCLYCWLTIATTTDVNLITNRASSPLPIIQTPIPIVGFYVVAPLLILCVYFYFHFYLQKLWEELGSLPAIFPDGRPLHTKVDPWLLNDLVRAHLPKLNVDRPFLSYLQLWISVLLAWWIVPVTMFLFWGRYLRRHEWIGTTFHVVLLILSLVGAVCLYRLAVATLRGAEREPFAWKGALTSRRGYLMVGFAVVAGVALGSLGPIGIPADLDGAEVSQKKSTWSREKDQNSDSVIGARLHLANLQSASAIGAFFAGADLSAADLTGANLMSANLARADLSFAHLVDAGLDFADLRLAKLTGAHLNGARLSAADLSGANLWGADLNGARLGYADIPSYGADLTYSDFRDAKNLKPEQVKLAQHWDKAFYDCKIIEALHLPLDNNVKLFEELHKDKEPQPNQDQRPPEACPSPPKQ